MQGAASKTREERREQASVAASEELARAGMQGSIDRVTKRAGVTAFADGTHHRISAAMHMTTGRTRPAWARLLEESGRTNARH